MTTTTKTPGAKPGKGCNGAGGLYRRSGRWTARWVDHDGRRRTRATGTTDKRAAERMLAEWTNAAALRVAGLVDPAADAAAEAARVPLAEHLERFGAAVLAKGSGARHVGETTKRAARLLAAGGVRRLPELTAERVLAGRERLRDEGLAASTLNGHTTAVKSFARWLSTTHRLPADPLRGVGMLNAAADRRRVRRVLERDEVLAVLAAAEGGPTRRGVTGPERAMAYRVAAGTGLRVSELLSLTPARFDLNPAGPAVTVAAGYSKRRREDVLPLAPELAGRLRAWLAGRPPRTRLWTFRGDAAADLLRGDLEAAGVAYEDEDGRVADFHALRGLFITEVVASGASVKVAQELARHSTPVLTMNVYARARLADTRAAVPDFEPDAPAAEAAAAVLGATGTDGGPPAPADARGPEAAETPPPAAPGVVAELRLVGADAAPGGGEPDGPGPGPGRGGGGPAGGPPNGSREARARGATNGGAERCNPVQPGAEPARRLPPPADAEHPEKTRCNATSCTPVQPGAGNTPGRIRTCDRRSRSPLLCPAELRAPRGRGSYGGRAGGARGASVRSRPHRPPARRAGRSRCPPFPPPKTRASPASSPASPPGR